MKITISGTKADNLKKLENILEKSKVLPQIVFSVEEWKQEKQNILEKIYFEKSNWKIYSNKYVVRSSAYDEDQKKHSNAGHYKSKIDVQERDLIFAIDYVINSYDETSEKAKNQVLVQPFLEDIRLCGVVFNIDPNTMGHYYIVNYALGDSTAITSGKKCEHQQLFVCSKLKECTHKDMGPLLRAVQEIENLVDENALDIEFAISDRNDIFVFQLRTLFLREKSISLKKQAPILKGIEDCIRYKQNDGAFLQGNTNVYSVMTDWNPAEMIGVHPRPLALSIYKEVITDQIWSQQRYGYGYMDLRSIPLLLDFGGYPYIDVRASFNSFVPRGLPESIWKKLINYYIKCLINNPENHDKVEFNIVFSCFTFDLRERLNCLYQEGFKKEEIDTLFEALKKLTNKIINGENCCWKKDIENIGVLNERYMKISKSTMPQISKMYWLLEDCKRYGALPFAGLARAAFIAMQLLKSLVDKKLIDQESYYLFLQSLNTISAEFRKDSSNLSREEMIQKYGHLRPGTYEITSARYDEAPDVFLKSQKGKGDVQSKDEKKFRLSLGQLENIRREIDSCGFNFSVTEMFEFMETTICWREYSKFIFTRNISDLLYLLEKQGYKSGISREDMSFCNIEIVKKMFVGCLNPAHEIRKSVATGKCRYEAGRGIVLPAIIFQPNDIYEFFKINSQPNFVTQNHVMSNVCSLKSNVGRDFNPELLDEKIVLIESADPGFDWIFSRRIVGLVTMWGGINSHMAIRAGELDIPAAIGVGEKIYAQVSGALLLELDAGQKKIKVIR